MLIQLIIIQATIFIGLILLLRVLFTRHLDAALGRLKRLHDENLAKEKELQAELEKVRQQREMELVKAMQEAGEIVKDAREKSKKASLDVEMEAREQARKILDQSTTELSKMEKELKAKHEDKALDLSTEIVRAVLSGPDMEAFQHKLIGDLIDEMKGLKQEKFTVKDKKIKIISALPLTREEKTKIISVLSSKAGHDLETEESVDGSIVAGMVIHMGAMTIDGSIKDKMNKVIPYLKGKGSMDSR